LGVGGIGEIFAEPVEDVRELFGVCEVPASGFVSGAAFMSPNISYWLMSQRGHDVDKSSSWVASYIEAKEETSLKLNIPAAFGGSALGWTGDFESP
jgi:hypothetical protein